MNNVGAKLNKIYLLAIALVTLLILQNLAFAAIQPAQDVQTELDFSAYLAKIMKPADIHYSIFDEQKYQGISIEEKQEIKNWLKAVDEEIIRLSLPRTEAKFIFSLNPSGHIESLSFVEKVHSNRFEKINIETFKDVASRLSNLKLPAKPAILGKRINFIFDSAFNYLERPISFAIMEEESEVKLKASVEFKDFAAELDKLEELSFALVSPSFIDTPSVGEKIILKLNSNNSDLANAKLLGQIIAVDKKKITVQSSSLNLSSGKSLWLAKVFQISNPNHGIRAEKVAEASLVGAAASSVGLGIRTYGIAPVSLALGGMVGGLISENSRFNPYNLSQGDDIKVTELSKSK